MGPDRKSLVNRAGRHVYAIDLPALTWQAFMDGALRDQPVQGFGWGPDTGLPVQPGGPYLLSAAPRWAGPARELAREAAFKIQGR